MSRKHAGLPTFALVLVNPLAGVSTPAIFRALQNKDNAPLVLAAAPVDENAWIAAIDGARNDLAAPARALCFTRLANTAFFLASIRSSICGPGRSGQR